MKYFFVLFTLILLASCAEVQTEIWVTEDGSGKNIMTIDASEMMDAIPAMLNEMSSDESNDKPKKDPFGEERIDSIISINTYLPDSIIQQISNPSALDIFQIRMIMDPEEKFAELKISYQYDSEEELEEFYSVIEEIGSLNPDQTMMAQAGQAKEKMEEMFVIPTCDAKNNVIRIPPPNIESLRNDEDLQLMGIDFDSIALYPQDSPKRTMLQMMGGGINSTTTLHAPGEILFTNDPKAKINGRTMTYTDINPIQMLLDGKEIPTQSKIIKYKD